MPTIATFKELTELFKNALVDTTDINFLNASALLLNSVKNMVKAWDAFDTCTRAVEEVRAAEANSDTLVFDGGDCIQKQDVNAVLSPWFVL